MWLFKPLQALFCSVSSQIVVNLRIGTAPLRHFHLLQLLPLITSAIDHSSDPNTKIARINPKIHKKVLYHHLMYALATPRFFFCQRNSGRHEGQGRYFAFDCVQPAHGIVWRLEGSRNIMHDLLHLAQRIQGYLYLIFHFIHPYTVC